jgi:hypothetical protein
MTVTPEQRRTIEHLNNLMSAKEVEQLRPTRGSWYEKVDRPKHYVCDACQRKLTPKCINLIIDMSGAFLREMAPVPDHAGCVIVRYHLDCYPKKLLGWMNSSFHERRSSTGVK